VIFAHESDKMTFPLNAVEGPDRSPTGRGTMNPLAIESNDIIKKASPGLFEALSELGRELFFPKGILTQTAEAKEKAHRYNATIGIARQDGEAMNLSCVMKHISDLSPDQVLDYAPSTGNALLREAWRVHMLEKNPSMHMALSSLPVVTAGITHGLTLCGEMFLDPGDIVVLPDKYWGNYRMIFGTRRSAQIKTYPFFDGTGEYDVGALHTSLDEALGEKGKAMVVLNFPNNPTGYSITKDDAGRLVDMLLTVGSEDDQIVVVLDDAYFGLFYDDDVLDESLFGLLAGKSDRVHPIKLDGATKEEYAWGLRVGFITFGARPADDIDRSLFEALEKKAGGAIRGNVSNCSQLSQSVVLAALADTAFDGERKAKYEVMKRRAAKVREALSNPDYEEYFIAYPFNAGYFMCLKMTGLDAEDVRVRLLDEFGVGVIAEGSDLRIAFSCLEEDEIPDLFDIIYRCAKSMRDGG